MRIVCNKPVRARHRQSLQYHVMSCITKYAAEKLGLEEKSQQERSVKLFAIYITILLYDIYCIIRMSTKTFFSSETIAFILYFMHFEYRSIDLHFNEKT